MGIIQLNNEEENINENNSIMNSQAEFHVHGKGKCEVETKHICIMKAHNELKHT